MRSVSAIGLLIKSRVLIKLVLDLATSCQLSFISIALPGLIQQHKGGIDEGKVSDEAYHTPDGVNIKNTYWSAFIQTFSLSG